MVGPFGTFGLLYSVSCVSAGNCSAVGTYEDSSGLQQGLLLTESAGHWATGVEAAPPEGTDGAVLSSVKCPSPGNCSAVGSCGDQGLLLTQPAGTWRTGVEAVMPLALPVELPDEAQPLEREERLDVADRA